MADILDALASRIGKHARTDKLKPQAPRFPESKKGNSISAEALYSYWANFLKENDILITETGTAAFGLGTALMPKGSSFNNQSLWGSIGWATPAAFGAAIAAPNRRVVLITGEGSHQLTAQEISQFARHKLKTDCVCLE